MDIGNLEINKNAVEEGVWKDIGIGDIRIKFRSPQSEYVQQVRKRLEAPYRAKIRKDTLSMEQKARLFFETMIQGGIIDWENVESNGETIPWKVENGRQILDPANYKDIGDAAVNAFLDTDSFLRDYDEDGEKNLLSASSGTQPLRIAKEA